MISSGKDVSWQAGQVFTDLNGMQSIKQHAGKDRDAAMHAAARQFESLFVNMMLKQMRQSSAVFGKDSYLSSSEIEFHQQMLDQQMAIKLSEGRGLGLADVIYRQMSQVKGAANVDGMSAAGDSLQKNTLQKDTTQAKDLADDAAGIALKAVRPADVAALDAALRRVSGVPASVPLHVMPDIEDPVPVAVDAEIIDSLVASGVMDEVPDLEALIARFRASAANSVRQARLVSLNADTAAAGTPEAFIRRAYAAAQQVAAQLGIDVQAVLAQSALESGWGENIANNNLFGIKADARWTGDRGLQSTLEFRDGVLAREQAWFRRYNDWQQSFEDYGTLIRNNPRYQQALEVGSDPHAYARALQRAGYATDPQYARKISDIINSDRFQLTLSQMALGGQE